MFQTGVSTALFAISPFWKGGVPQTGIFHSDTENGFPYVSADAYITIEVSCSIYKIGILDTVKTRKTTMKAIGITEIQRIEFELH